MIERVKEDLVGIQSTDSGDGLLGEIIDFIAVFIRLKINSHECVRDLTV
jgi:hypothetical protein